MKRKIEIAIAAIIISMLSVILLYDTGKMFTAIESLNESSQSLNKFESAVKEVAYSYYMRGKNIQYNTHKRFLFSPEDATSQNTNYLVCSGFTQVVYYELFNIRIPTFTDNLLKYARTNVGNKEIIGYGKTETVNGNKVLNFKLRKTDGSDYVTLTNPKVEDIVPYLKVGDVLTYTGHTILVYDIKTDSNGKKVAYMLQSGHGSGKNYVNSKIATSTKLGTLSYGSANYLLYHNSKKNTNFDEGVVEGSVNMSELSVMTAWKELEKATRDEYSIIRFATVDNNGNVILNYQGANFDDKNHTDEVITLSKSNQDRVNYSKLYIEKIVDKYDHDIVVENDKVTYTIYIKNNSDSKYKNDLIVKEDLSSYVTYQSNTCSKNTAIFTKQGNTLKWNIGKLDSGESVTIKYTVKINSGTFGKEIINKGYVGNISSGAISNKVGYILPTSDKEIIKTSYTKLKSKYSSKELINEIYKDSLGIDLHLEKFDIKSLILDSNKGSSGRSTLSLNENHDMYEAILNKYWSTMYMKYKTYNTTNDVIFYSMKSWLKLEDSSRRADTIYNENFETGDILIYLNSNDVKYSVKNNALVTTKVTNEDGEYAYIFIEGMGFVGVNLGNDGIKNTLDDRNEFNASYYKDNNLTLISDKQIGDNDYFEYSDYQALSSKVNIIEFSNYQTLFGKDYYVILRPSLLKIEKGIKMEKNPNKSEYLQNTDTLDLSGGSISLIYFNNTNKIVSLTDKDVKLSGFDNTKLGKNTITVTYHGFTTTFDVNIAKAKVTNLKVTNNPIKTTYTVRDNKLDLSGGELMLYYSDGKSEKISMSDKKVKITGFDNLKPGKNTIVIEYEGIKSTLEINVVDIKIKEIKVSKNPGKMEYIVNKDNLDLSGGQIKVVYDDGVSEYVEMTNKDVVVSGFDNSNVAKNKLVIEYKGNKTELFVNIVDNVKEPVKETEPDSTSEPVEEDFIEEIDDEQKVEHNDNKDNQEKNNNIVPIVIGAVVLVSLGSVLVFKFKK